MPNVRRRESSDSFGQRLSDTTVSAFDKSRHCDVLLISSEGEKIQAHQCMLSKSPTLAVALRTGEVRYQAEAILLFPEFKRKSLLMLLQFLYTGEVELVSGSQVLVEFQELCKILKINPPVRKNRLPVTSASKESHSSSSMQCSSCKATFDKPAKMVFHRQFCRNLIHDLFHTNGEDSDENDSQRQKPASIPPPPATASEVVIEAAGPSNNNLVVPSSSSSCESQEDEEVKEPSNNNKSVGGGFQMPDNFDLPDEIIQEKLPARYTSTPIRYAEPVKSVESVHRSKTSPTGVEGKKGEPSKKDKEDKKKLEEHAQRKKEVHQKERKIIEEVQHKDSNKKKRKAEPEPVTTSSSTGLSVAEELAAKKKRMMLKLRGDEDIRTDGALERRDKKRSTKHRKDKFMRRRQQRMLRLSHKMEVNDKKHVCTTACPGDHSFSDEDDWLDVDDMASHEERWEPDSTDESEDDKLLSSSSEEITKSTFWSRRRGDPLQSEARPHLATSSGQYHRSGKLKVSLQLEGDEPIVELVQYRMQLQLSKLGSDSDNETDHHLRAKKHSNKKTAKRINRLVSDSSVSEEEREVRKEVKKPQPPLLKESRYVAPPGLELAQPSTSKVHRDLNMPPPVAPIKVVGPPKSDSSKHLSANPAPQRNTLSGLSFKKKPQPPTK